MNFITVTIVCTMLVILVQSIVVKKKNCSNQNSGSPKQCPKPRTMMCIDGVLTAEDNISCMKGYTRIVYATSVCLNQTIEDTLCVPDKISDATLIFFGSSKYLFVRYFANALEAKNSCSRVCGSLVEINNEEENTFLATTAKELKMQTLTIGLEYNGTDFVWPSGNTTDAYTNNWSPGPISTLTCVRLVSDNTKWVIIDCTSLSRFVCELREN